MTKTSNFFSSIRITELPIHIFKLLILKQSETQINTELYLIQRYDLLINKVEVFVVAREYKGGATNFLTSISQEPT
jgi:hypothetical protein